ncbi:hypothetical protein DPEC_G00119190 [Dallia pectoralis]|uniref:Uncharacterized protein n=1 Tax=Dallia pectoralis TaxID=75939 RepID=A0ACC2GQ24_DALPE|nr:hypothetical protein DPEC_G00119190 [Dallia pectoralis]
MNIIILSCLLCLVCSAAGVRGSVVAPSEELGHVTGASASGEGEGLLSAFGDEDEEEAAQDEGLAGGSATDSQSQHPAKDQRAKEKRRKGKGNKDKRKTKAKSTTAFNPEYSGYTPSGLLSGSTSGRTQADQTSDPITKDPCSSSHQGYCIHGICKYMADLREPVCVCYKGYDGERCGILLLQTKNENDNSSVAEMAQTVLVIIAVVLSIISCLAILLMVCSHYRTHKNFLSAYLGSGSEKENLQKTTTSENPV